MPRIAVKVQPLVKNLPAHFCPAVRGRVGAAAFVGAAGVEPKPDKITGSLGFQYDRINTGRERDGGTRRQCFLNRLVRDVRGFEFGDIKMVAQEITGAAAVGSPGGDG